ncbi:MAG: hypothetical protein CVU39_10070 [Chloroflexi bacterium HGW-Chloroflexi-10]|nr:MAG: hypothetical protein CVU39_10070 [Chloroflexi bacterium HGW-Chloroflexi-10]
MKKKFFSKAIYLLLAILIAGGLFAIPNGTVNAATITVCASGCDYTTIQAAITAAAPGDTINVAAGTYTEDVVINKTNLSLIGAGRDITFIVGPKTGSSNTLVIGANGVIVEGFTISRDGNNLTDWNSTVKSQGVIFSQGITGAVLQNCTVTHNRNGVYINNAQGNSILNNIISDNRTGIQFANNIANTIVQNNEITDNWTLGVLFNFNSITPTPLNTGIKINNNTISGNWYGDVQNRWNSISVIDLTKNYFGTQTLVVNSTNSAEPGYADLIPVEFGGTSVNPGTAANIGGTASQYIDYSPWLGFSSSTIPMTYYTNSSIQEAIDLAAAGDTVFVKDGSYSETLLINKPLTLQGESREGVVIDAGASATYGIYVTSDDVTLDTFTLKNGTTYGIKPSGVDNFTLQNVTVQNTGRSGIDLNGVNGGVINNVISSGTPYGVGIALTDSNNIAVSNVTTSGNAWGGMAIYTYGRYHPGGSDNIVLSGTNSFSEINQLYIELDQYPSGDAYPATNLTLGGMAYKVYNSAAPDVTWYSQTFSGAKAITPFTPHPTTPMPTKAAIQSLDTGEFIVEPGLTIQAAIDAAQQGDSIKVYPGDYNEFAVDRYIQKPTGPSGPYQFGLFIGQDKAGITIEGVDAAGNVITDYDEVLANVKLNSTANFGPSGMFVEGDNVTVQGLKLWQNVDLGQNKTIEVIGDNFALEYCHVDALDSSAVYLNDWAFDEVTDTSHLQSYKLNANWIDTGSIDINSGAGYSGPVSDRLITNNKITDNGEYAAISFTGSGSGVPWFINGVGGATITGNEFANNDQHIRARGIYDNSQFNWMAYWNENTFDKAVIVGANPPNDIREYSYVTSYGTMPDVRRISGVIQGEIDNGLPGDTVLIQDGTYVEVLTIAKDLTLIGESSNVIVQAPAVVPTCFTTSYNAHSVICIKDAEVTLDTLTVDGAGKGNANNRFMGVAFRNAGGAIQNAKILNVEDTPFSGTQHGVALFAYNNDTVARSLTVDNVYIKDFQKNAMAINASADTPLTVDIKNNDVIGQGPTAITAQNGIQVSGDLITGTIENNTITGIGYDNTSAAIKYVATSILNFYADVDVIGNTVTEAQMGLYNIDGGGRFADNTFEINMVGVSGYGMILTDPPTAVPAPFEAAATSIAAGMNSLVKSATENLVVVENNTVVFEGADNTGTIGIDAESGYDVKDMHVTLTANTVMGFDYGVAFFQCVGSDCSDAVFTNISANFNRIVNNNFGLYSDVAAVTVDAENNWWGCNAGPGAAGCNPIDGTGTIDAAPWLVLTVIPDASELEPGLATDIEAGLYFNSVGLSTVTDGFLPDDILVTFTTPLGGIVLPSSGLTVNAVVNTTFTPPVMHADYQVCAAVDNELVCPEVTVVAPDAVNDQYQTTEDVTLVVAAPGVMSNDTGITTINKAVALLVAPLHGKLTLNANGSFTYIPDADFVGVDTFEYQLITYPADGNAKSTWADEAIVTITVLPGIPVTGGTVLYLPIIFN